VLKARQLGGWQPVDRAGTLSHWLVASLFLSYPASTFAASAQVIPVPLLTEGLTNPVGIDSLQPRLRWKLASGGRNIEQAAYEIRVAQSLGVRIPLEAPQPADQLIMRNAPIS
jgi:hypothetical protein